MPSRVPHFFALRSLNLRSPVTPLRILLGLCAAMFAAGLYFVFIPATVDGRLLVPRGEQGNTAPDSAVPTRWRDSPFALRGSLQADPAKPPSSLSRPTHDEPILGRNGRTVNFGGLTPQQYIAKWSSQARIGNLEAAYRVYQAESVCAANDDPETEFVNPAEREQFVARRDAQQKLCAGVTPAQVQERLHFLGIAARGGNSAAQIDFYTEGPNGKTLDLAESKNDAVVEQWKKEAIEFLKSAGDHGEPFALGLLSMAYDVGDLVPQDSATSLAYSVAEATLRKHPVAVDQLRRRYGGQLTDADFQQALQRGQRMAQDCCKQ